MSGNILNNTQCGVDIIEVKRIKKLVSSSPRFTNRIFTKEEIKYCRKKKNKWQHFAVRFAAKEAIWKSLGNMGMALRDIGIKNTQEGKPCPVLAPKFKKYEKHISVSLSHTAEYAVAFAVYTK